MAAKPAPPVTARTAAVSTAASGDAAAAITATSAGAATTETSKTIATSAYALSRCCGSLTSDPHSERIAAGTCGSERPPAAAHSGERPGRRTLARRQHEPGDRHGVHSGRRPQHARLPEAVHQPALCNGTERVGEAERRGDAPGIRERAGRLAPEQHDAQDVHADRQRAGGGRDDRPPDSRQREQRAIAPEAGHGAGR